ncbi:hypothetical protein IV203_019651 [Nitzschia inconspicua]|uniref:Uncharacterized protein n=1 Tax=Nitzschia inconspicua TaxID=303405 RepID=A0A9K3Q559_9STRA|nr:hypothetical protein IV203_019651 [Nitzschia inconspicua]
MCRGVTPWRFPHRIDSDEGWSSNLERCVGTLYSSTTFCVLNLWKYFLLHSRKNDTASGVDCFEDTRSSKAKSFSISPCPRASMVVIPTLNPADSQALVTVLSKLPIVDTTSDSVFPAMSMDLLRFEAKMLSLNKR